jgi:seryl-tRNA synthetase
MLDLNFIVENTNLVKDKTEKRNVSFNFDLLLSLNNDRKNLIKEVENLKNTKNKVSKEIGVAKKQNLDLPEKTDDMRLIADKIKILDGKLKDTLLKINDIILLIPNLIDDTVPSGKNDANNVVLRYWGKKPSFTYKPLPHWDLAEKLGIVDFERASKLSKSRFSIYKGYGARLERAIINFMLDTHSDHGYKEIFPPLLVNEDTMKGTGQLPKFEEELFKCERDNLYLIPTAEVPLTNIPAGEIIPVEQLPIYYTAYTPCFRREAGSYGKDVRGLIRQHQFNKVELVKIVESDKSDSELELLLADAERILQALNIHYRVVLLCSADTGFSSSKTYDIEVWLPGMDCYREISSCSNFKDFQARRANIKYRGLSGKTSFVHTLNGSALAAGRTFVAILENYQQENGTIVIPEALRPYMKGKEIITSQ